MIGDFPHLPHLRLIGEIGRGGMSTVWKAMDLNREEIVAVKVLNQELTTNEDDLEMFRAEANALKSLDHPGIVRCYEMNCIEGVWYYVMELIDGYSFADLLSRKQSLQEPDCLLICESLAVALQYAWNTHGIVHCDIKPENVMINSEGVVKLMDLGLCHTFRHLAEGSVEVPEQVLGTPSYISPEQIYGDVELDCRADIYSLGATLYHLATGRIIFPGLGADDLLRAHCSENCQGQDPRNYKPKLSEGFCQMLEAMLVKDRDWRVNNWDIVIETCHDVQRGIRYKRRNTPGVSSIMLNAATLSLRSVSVQEKPEAPHPLKLRTKLQVKTVAPAAKRKSPPVLQPSDGKKKAKAQFNSRIHLFSHTDEI